MNFQQLKYVRQAVRSRFNLTEVAEALYTSQSGVSKQIRDLEAELGVEIFIRKGKRLVGLTKAGEGVAALAERILLDAENLKRLANRFTQSDKGALVVATTHNQARYTLPAVVRELLQRFPDVQLELRQGTPEQAAQAVIDGSAHLAIATEALDRHKELQTFPCFTWSHVVIAPRGHALAQMEAPTLADVARHPLVTYSPDFSGRAAVDEAFEREGLAPDIRLTATDADVIKTYVELGLGLGIVAEMAMKGEAGDGLVTLGTPEAAFPPCVTKVAIRRGALLEGYAYRFIEMFAPHLTEAVLTGAARPGRAPPAPGGAPVRVRREARAA